jgi:hypothetical protein
LPQLDKDFDAQIKSCSCGVTYSVSNPNFGECNSYSQEIPSVFEKLLATPTLSNPAMIVIDGSTGQTIMRRIFCTTKASIGAKSLNGGDGFAILRSA